MNTPSHLIQPGRQRLWSNLQRGALQEVDHIRRNFPAPYRDRVRGLQICFEPVPDRKLMQAGVDPDAMSLVVQADSEMDTPITDSDRPGIVLFLNCIWDSAGGNTQDYREIVRITCLKAVADCLGLDADDMISGLLE